MLNKSKKGNMDPNYTLILPYNSLVFDKQDINLDGHSFKSGY